MARPSRRVGNLPAEATSFVGRRRLLAELRKTLSEARLVSLVGPGGVGKTRLALRTAGDLARAFPDGVWLVELAEVQDPTLVSSAVMAAVGLRDQAAAEPLALVRSFVRDKKLLLVLDNCEHLLVAAARLATEILKAAPGVRLLATSREPLSAAGEHVVPIPPLELPSPDDSAPLTHQNEAVTLFAERAAAASGTFELTASNQTAVAELCRRLDGLPLAIELAAVRTRVLTAEQILDRLTDRFALLTGGGRAALPRHQTLRTTLEWSHDLLAKTERILLRRLCVFAGRFTLEDAESVCASEDVPPPRILDLLSSLVEKSLVTRETAARRACYRLHETVRDYARLKLRDAGEEDALEHRCADHYVSRCLRSAEGARYTLVEWLEWTELEIDNLRAVLRRLLAHGDTPRGMALASSLGWYWLTRATTEGARWLDALLPPGGGTPAAPPWTYFIRGFLAVLKDDPGTATQALERAAAAARATGQLLPLAHSLVMLSVARNMVGDRASARRALEDARLAAAGIDDVSARVAILQAQAIDAFYERDLDTVRAACSEGARLSREAGDLYSLEHMLLNLGVAALLDGDLGGAPPLLRDALRVAHQIDDRVVQSYLLGALACHAAASADHRLAVRLLGAAEAMRTGAGAGVNPVLAPVLSRAQDAAQTTLGAAKYEAEFKTGERSSAERAAELALGAPARAAKPPSAHAGEETLAKREREVAALIADGLSNKEIGATLFISERTVDSHVRSILNKLGISSRAQIAAWIASSRP